MLAHPIAFVGVNSLLTFLLLYSVFLGTMAASGTAALLMEQQLLPIAWHPAL